MVETREMSPGREGESHTVCVLANRSLGISLMVQKYNFCQSRCVIVGIFIDSTKGMGTNYKPNLKKKTTLDAVNKRVFLLVKYK